MVPAKTFRSSLHGFNREDVVRYIEFLNNQHVAHAEQLTNQLRAALAQAQNPDLQTRLDEANARIAQLEQELANVKPAPLTPDELEIYRRAERTERLAQERARQIYTQANSALADASSQALELAQRIGTMSGDLSAKLEQYASAVREASDAFQESAAALGAISPEE